MRIAIDSDDHTALSDAVLKELKRGTLEVELFGALRPGDDPAWPQVTRKVAEEVAEGRSQQGILFCYTGTGVSIAANKATGVRAALCTDGETARGARLWNDANLLCMSLRLTSPEVAREILDAWLSTPEIDESERDNIERVNTLDRPPISERAGFSLATDQ